MIPGNVVEELQQAAQEYLQRQHEEGPTGSQPMSDDSPGVLLRRADEGRERAKAPVPLADLVADRRA
jgi:hypothetical protein